jgi:hypothetical protein
MSAAIAHSGSVGKLSAFSYLRGKKKSMFNSCKPLFCHYRTVRSSDSSTGRIQESPYHVWRKETTWKT